jgi:hypothetical protein
LAEQFRARRGYDIVPHLPALFSGTGPETTSIRHDWGQTLTELTNERYLATARAWAARNHTQFRSQTYGFPAVVLSSNDLVDLPEGEGIQWRGFTTTRWATSGSHLYGRNVTSAETWTWLHSPAFRATPLDMKAEADRMFLQGVNQIVGHGWPYSPGSAGEPGWAFYAAGAFNDHNPWWPVMPELTRYLQRISSLLRRGTPVNDVAVYLPTDDALAQFTPGHTSVNELMKEMISGTMTQQILDAGFNFDYIDSAAIDKRGIHYPILILPHVHRIPLSTYTKISEYSKHGGKVIAIGDAPVEAPGFLETAASPQVQELSERLFRDKSGSGKIVATDSALGSALKEARTPDMQAKSPAPQIGFVHRRLPYADIYFVANTSNQPVRTFAKFQSSYANYEWWDPMSAKAIPAGNGEVEIVLAPYESRVLVASDQVSQNKANLGRHEVLIHHPQEEKVLADLSHDWQVRFKAINHSEQFAALRSWTENPATRFFSGEALYQREFILAEDLARGATVVLDFGEGTPVAPETDSGKPGMRALIESPIREMGMVYVNDRLAGSVWHPPYRVDVSSLLHPGTNRIEIRVDNLAINTLAGRTLPDYRLLNSRFGERFQMQDMKDLRPLPSGILGPIRLILY